MFNINNLKTAAFLALLTALLVLVGRIFGGASGMIIAFGFALLLNFFSYWFSDKVVLRMTGARAVTEAKDPELYAIVREVASRARMPMPKVYEINNPSPNAFATGRDPNHAAVAVTTGIRRVLSNYELAGVLAHEMAHVRNRDTLTTTIVATIAGAISLIAQMGQWALLFGGYGGNRNDNRDAGIGGILAILIAPIVATMVQLAISRAREYEADATGARITGNPEPLANALAKLDDAVQRMPMKVSPAAEHLFIVNPFGNMQAINQLFSTHPPMGERIARLRSMQPADYLSRA